MFFSDNKRTTGSFIGLLSMSGLALSSHGLFRNLIFHPGQHGETPSLLKIQKVSWARWRVPVIPATQEAEAGELPEPRRRRLR